jgi:3-methylcrotonyl-CoA carboxylase alpha subunit
MARSITLRSPSGEHRAEIEGNRITVDGRTVEAARRAYAIANGHARWVFLDGEVYEFEVVQPGPRRAAHGHETLTAPMPATVVRINTPVGTAVKRGETLLVLEAMKMELPVRAIADGTVTAVHCSIGQLVQPGVSLIELD